MVCYIMSLDLKIDVVMEFELTEYFVNESDGSLTVSVVLQNIELRMPISVLLATEDMTASMFCFVR